MAKRKLTAKQKKFCREYLKDLNGTQAAIRSGYSEKGANVQASMLLSNINIQEKISKLQKKVAERNDISIDECVQMLAKLARFDIAEIYDERNNLRDIHNIDKDARMSLEGVDVDETTLDGVTRSTTRKVRTADRKKAIEMLMRHLGGFERDNSQRDQGNVVIYNIPSNGRE